MNVANVIFIKFKATQLEVSKKYVLDMGVSVCLEPNQCDLNVPILNQVLIPILNCDLTMDFNIQGEFNIHFNSEDVFHFSFELSVFIILPANKTCSLDLLLIISLRDIILLTFRLDSS